MIMCSFCHDEICGLVNFNRLWLIPRRLAAEKEFPVQDDLGNDPAVMRAHFADVVVTEKMPGDVVSRSLIRHDSKKIAESIGTLL